MGSGKPRGRPRLYDFARLEVGGSNMSIAYTDVAHAVSIQSAAYQYGVKHGVKLSYATDEEAKVLVFTRTSE